MSLIFHLINQADGSDATDTPTATTNVDGAGYGPAGGTLTNRGGGSWAYTPSGGELSNTLGVRMAHANIISQVKNYLEIARNSTDPIDFQTVKPDGSNGDLAVGALTVTVSQNGGAFGGAAGTLTARGGGAFSYQPTAPEINVDDVAIKITGTGILTQVINVRPLVPTVGCDYPSESDVRSGVPYDSGNLTGSAAIPAPTDVRLGVSVDATTGTVVIPLVTDVRTGIDYDVAPNAKTGTLVLPQEKDVAPNAKTGTLVLPQEKDVRKGIPYDVAPSAKEGNLVLPTEAQVLLGIDFGSDDPTSEFTGNVTLPSVNDVRLGTTFGSLLSLTGNVTLPTEAQVQAGVTYDSLLSRTGTYDPIATSVFPPDTKVLLNEQYGPNGNDFTGRWHDQNLSGQPTNVRVGVTYGIDGAEVGTLDPAGSVNPSPPPFSTLYGIALDEDGQPEQGVEIECRILTPPDGDTGRVYDARLRQTLSESDGSWQFANCPQQSTYQIRRGGTLTWTNVVISGEGTTPVDPSFIGKDVELV